MRLEHGNRENQPNGSDLFTPNSCTKAATLYCQGYKLGCLLRLDFVKQLGLCLCNVDQINLRRLWAPSRLNSLVIGPNCSDLRLTRDCDGMKHEHRVSELCRFLYDALICNIAVNLSFSAHFPFPTQNLLRPLVPASKKSRRIPRERPSQFQTPPISP